MSEPVVHLVLNAQQGDIQIWCSGLETEPAWGAKVYTDVTGVYRTDGGDLYTFNRSQTTCPLCLGKETP